MKAMGALSRKRKMKTINSPEEFSAITARLALITQYTARHFIGFSSARWYFLMKNKEFTTWEFCGETYVSLWDCRDYILSRKGHCGKRPVRSPLLPFVGELQAISCECGGVKVSQRQIKTA